MKLVTIYRDTSGQLYFKDDDGDWLYFEPDNPPTPEQVVQLPGEYCLNNGRGPIDTEKLERDIPKGVVIELPWEEIKSESCGL